MKNIDDDLQKLQHDIQNWSDKTFGQRTPLPLLIKLKKEIDEVIEAIENENLFAHNAPNELRGGGRDGEWHFTDEARDKYLQLKRETMFEFADCFMLLIDAMAHYPMTLEMVRRKSVEKLEILKKRKWERLEDGTMQHIEE